MLESRDLLTAISLYQHHPRAVVAAQVDTTGLTRREIAREKFTAGFKVSYGVGVPQNSDQARRVAYTGNGSSNRFLHGMLTMKIDTPGAPGAAFEGTATLRDRNVNNILLVDLQGDPTSLDRFGRPTRLTWSVNSNGSGTFTSASGQGTLTITYLPGGTIKGAGAGRAIVRFSGQVKTTGVTNPNGVDPFGPQQLS